MNIIDEMANEAMKDDYFLSLFGKAEEIQWDSILRPSQLSQEYYTNDEFNDILTFADILSLSTFPECHNAALKIISCLSKIYCDDSKFNYFSKGIMIRMGNFPGYELLTRICGKDFKLPLDLSIEKSFKQLINKDKNSDKIFTDAQFEVWQKLFEKNHFSFAGPTSFGKSFILTSFIRSILLDQKRGINIAFLVPTRALVSQTLRKMKEVVKDVEGYYLSSSPEIPALVKTQNAHYVFVFTPERLLHYFSLSRNPSIEYIFIDEAQKLVSDDTRSVVYYHAISLAERRSCKLFFSAPNIRNTDIFLKMFNKTTEENMTIFEAPVCQSRIFVDMIEKKIQLFSDWETVKTIEYCLPEGLPAVIKKISDNVNGSRPQSLIYCNTIEDTIKCAVEMAEVLDYSDSQEITMAAEEIAKFIHKDYYLVELIRKGVGFHFGKLPQKIRDIIEKLYDNGAIHYLFCTSTLLEGVNLPAQNIFILNNQIGNRNLRNIDFWNLAGRAGRLTKELCGNVICIRWINKDGRWNTVKSVDLIKYKQLESINADIISGKANFYNNIFHAVKDEPFTNTSISETQRRVYTAYSNVLVSHYSENQFSLLLNEFQKKRPQSVEELTKIQKELSVPVNIISKFPLIKFKYQDEIWKRIPYNCPIMGEPTYDACLSMLEFLCDLYHWDIEESRGKNPFLPHGNKNILRHYAGLMEKWMSSTPINEIISKSLYNMKGKKVNMGYSHDGKMILEQFNEHRKDHINVVINDVISQIETCIRFTLKNYFENYYCLLESKLGKHNCGENWSLYLEHGTRNTKLIEVQKIGIPRHLSKIFLDDFGDLCVFNKDCELISLNMPILKKRLESNKSQNYQEIKEILLDNCILTYDDIVK